MGNRKILLRKSTLRSNKINWLISTYLMIWLVNHNLQEEKHHGRTWLIRAQALQILWDFVHILTDELNSLWGTLWAAINQHKYFYQVFKTVYVISQTNFITSVSKFLFVSGIIFFKCLQSTKSEVKCYKKWFIKLEFCEFIRKKCDGYPYHI